MSTSLCSDVGNNLLVACLCLSFSIIEVLTFWLCCYVDFCKLVTRSLKKSPVAFFPNLVECTTNLRK